MLACCISRDIPHMFSLFFPSLAQKSSTCTKWFEWLFFYYAVECFHAPSYCIELRAFQPLYIAYATNNGLVLSFVPLQTSTLMAVVSTCCETTASNFSKSKRKVLCLMHQCTVTGLSTEYTVALIKIPECLVMFKGRGLYPDEYLSSKLQGRDICPISLGTWGFAVFAILQHEAISEAKPGPDTFTCDSAFMSPLMLPVEFNGWLQLAVL